MKPVGTLTAICIPLFSLTFFPEDTIGLGQEIFQAWKKALNVTAVCRLFIYASTVGVQPPSPVRLFVTPRTAGPQAFLSLTIAPSLPEFMSLEPVMLLYPYRWICIYIHIYISVYDFMYALLLVTKISD